MSTFSAIFQNSLNLSLDEISIRELLFLREAPCSLYISEDGVFKLSTHKGQVITKELIKDFMARRHFKLFVKSDEYHYLVKIQQENLRNITRSLSIGDSFDKAKKMLDLLTINLAYLYKNPTDNQKLSIQYQSVKNLVNFLADNPKLHSRLYREYTAKKHHYIYAQPLLSSMFLLGILQQSKLISRKELESLFITSYFKDIGMSAVPIEKYNSPELTENEKKLFAKHPELSVSLLAGRIQLAPSYLEMIKSHHTFSLLGHDDLNADEKYGKIIAGFETMIISATDIIAAMISERPYREATSLFDALELIRVLIAESYPQEFRFIVHYFRQFFKN